MKSLQQRIDLPWKNSFDPFLILFWAAMGFVFRKALSGVRFSLVGYFLVTMNLAFLVGLLHSILGGKEAAWQRSS